jgi:hypothetical protein
MFAVHLRTKKKLEFWQIGDADEPKWVSSALTDGGFTYINGKLRVLGTYGIDNMLVSATDVLIFNGKYLKILPKVKFEREYRVE